MDRIALVEWLDKSRNKCPKNIYLYRVGIVTRGIFEINNVFGVVQSKKFFSTNNLSSFLLTKPSRLFRDKSLTRNLWKWAEYLVQVVFLLNFARSTRQRRRNAVLTLLTDIKCREPHFPTKTAERLWFGYKSKLKHSIVAIIWSENEIDVNFRDTKLWRKKLRSRRQEDEKIQTFFLYQEIK